MGKYRYARANGEFITSEILERVQSVTPGFFTVDQSYNLTKTFVSGTHGDVNSFVSSQISGYAGSGNLAGWWRLNKDVSSKGSVTDSSGKGRTGTFDAVGDRPAYSTALYPSAYIQKSSYTFDASDDAINIGTAATWNAIIGDDIAAGATQKMSFAAWVYRSVAAGSARRVIDFGNYMGRAFQIRDDFLGIWGDEATTGKTSSGDIEQRKKSLPIVIAFEDARGAAADELLRIYRPDNKEELSDKDIEVIRMILDEVKAAERCQLLTEQSSEDALTALNDLDFSAWAVAEAKDLVHFLSTREF